MTQPSSGMSTRFNQSQEYDSPTASRAGRRRAAQTVRIDRRPAVFDLAGQLREAGVRSGEDAVDYLAVRFLRVPLSEQRRHAVLDFIEGELDGKPIDYEAAGTEEALRALLHLVMSAPEYQLS